MNIFTMLLGNFTRRPITLPFPQRPPAPAGYRGLVQFDPSRCIGCGSCAGVCTSSAIKFKGRRDTYQWSYDAGQCTFCGRCVEVCPSGAITMQELPPPIYSVSGALKCSYTMQRQKPGAQEEQPAAKQEQPGVKEEVK